jgi:hypothetical protein
MNYRGLWGLLLLAGALLAQDFRATLTGQVTDPTGSVIPGALVKTLNLATNEAKEARTTAEGLYTVPYLEPGMYTVEISAQGFDTLKRENLTLEVAQRMDLPVRLQVGAASTEITVSGQQELTDSGDANRGLVFDPIKVQEYPLNGRQTYMLMDLTPGVMFMETTFGPTGYSGTRAWDVSSAYKINGAREGFNNLFLLNGAPISDNQGTWQFAPTVDAVQEFKVMTSTYDAAYGRVAGGVVNSTIKSGGNKWHGDIYDYWRNVVLDANFFQNNLTVDPKTGKSAPKGYHNWHQFGGVVGGPVRKDRDFIFASYEGLQEVVPQPAQTTTVPMEIRDGQNFGLYGMTIYDPLTRHACGSSSSEHCPGSSNGSQYWENPFPGDAIPQSRISPIGKKILSYFPAPDGGGFNQISNNYVANHNEGRYWYNQEILRWDHVFGPRAKLYGMYTEFHGYEYRSSIGFAKPLATGNTDNNRTDNNAILGYTHIISPSIVLDVPASYGRFTQWTPGYNDQSSNFTATGPLDGNGFGMTGMIHAPTVSTDRMPNISIGGFGGPVFGNGSYSWAPYNQWNIRPNVTVTRGRHTIRTGFEMNYVAKGAVSPGAAWGTLSFGSGWTRQASDIVLGGDTTSTYNSVATLLLGFADGGSIANNQSSYTSRPYYGTYVQDDWKVSPRLTVNLELRYDVQPAWIERFNRRNAGFDMTAVNPVSAQVLAAWAADKAAYDATLKPDSHGELLPYPAVPTALYGKWEFEGQNGWPRRLYDTDWTNLAPRFGFAYKVQNKTVIRGGVGVYYQTTTQDGTTNGLSQSTSLIVSNDNNATLAACDNARCQNGPPTGPYSLVQPFPQGIATPLGASGGFNTAIGNSVGFDPRHYKVPRTYQYSLGFQRQLPRSIVADISFSGNLAIYGAYGLDQNWPAGQAGLDLYARAIQDSNFFTRTVANPFYGILPITSSAGASPSQNAQSLMGYYPLWDGGMTNNLVQGQDFRSDALHVRIEQRSFGNVDRATGVLTWVLSETFSKELSHIGRQDYSWDTTQPLYYELDSADRTHSFSFSGVWDVPMGKGRYFLNTKNKVADAILGGWRADWIGKYTSGAPMGWPHNINYCGQWTAPDMRWPDGTFGKNQYHWFNNNAKCYANYPAYVQSWLPNRFGNIRQPAAPTYNIAIAKNYFFHERYRLQFRGEAFNLSNTPLRSIASTSFTSQQFGQIAQSQNNFPRNVQLALKLYF